jgi:hypothetical protein
MQNLLLWIGRLAGIGGVLTCAAAVIVRLYGRFFIGGFQVLTLLQVGVAAMVLGCLAYLAVLSERRQP